MKMLLTVLILITVVAIFFSVLAAFISFVGVGLEDNYDWKAQQNHVKRLRVALWFLVAFVICIVIEFLLYQ